MKGGLRGVVWTDTMQAFLIILTPIIVFAKIGYDVAWGDGKVRPLRDTDFRRFIME